MELNVAIRIGLPSSVGRKNQRGFIISAEYILIGTLIGIPILVTMMAPLRHTIDYELMEMDAAVVALNEEQAPGLIFTAVLDPGAEGAPLPDPEFQPLITNPFRVTTPENQALALDVMSADYEGDTEGSGLTYAITGGPDAALFTINPNTGILNFVVPPDFENPGDVGMNNVYNVQVTVTDSTGQVGRKNFAVTVTDVNEPISFVWSPGTTVGGSSNDFNSATQTFTAIPHAVNRLTLSGSALAHDHSAGDGGVTITITLFNPAGNTVATIAIPGGGQANFNGQTYSFSALTNVSGIQFSSSPGQNQTFHGFNGLNITLSHQ